MPCNSDYLEPSSREKELQRAATLLVYVQKKTGVTPKKWTLKEAENIYASDERSVTQLCATLKAMNPKQRDALVYNARDKVARDLADWWEEHQRADAERIAQEKREKRYKQLRIRAKNKLSKEERRALGIK